MYYKKSSYHDNDSINNHKLKLSNVETESGKFGPSFTKSFFESTHIDKGIYDADFLTIDELKNVGDVLQREPNRQNKPIEITNPIGLNNMGQQYFNQPTYIHPPDATQQSGETHL